MFENLTADFSQFLTIGVHVLKMEFLFFSVGGGGKSFPRGEKNSSNQQKFCKFVILNTLLQYRITRALFLYFLSIARN
jgi:hypothetical protein